MWYKDVATVYRFSRRTTVIYVVIGLALIAAGATMAFLPANYATSQDKLALQITMLILGAIPGLPLICIPFVTSLHLYEDRLTYTGLFRGGTVYRTQILALYEISQAFGVFTLRLTVKNSNRSHRISACGPVDDTLLRWFGAYPIGEWLEAEERWDRILANPAFGGTEDEQIAAINRHTRFTSWWPLLCIGLPLGIYLASKPAGFAVALAIPVLTVLAVALSGSQWCFSPDRELPRLPIGHLAWVAPILPIIVAAHRLHFLSWTQLGLYSLAAAIIAFLVVTLAEWFFRTRRLLAQGLFYLAYGFGLVANANALWPHQTAQVIPVQIVEVRSGAHTYRTTTSWQIDGVNPEQSSAIKTLRSWGWRKDDFANLPADSKICAYVRSGGLGLKWYLYGKCPETNVKASAAH